MHHTVIKSLIAKLFVEKLAVHIHYGIYAMDF